MKIERFLKWIEYQVVNRAELDFPTVKLFIREFYSCLSPKEQDRHILTYQSIMSLTKNQITIKDFTERLTNKELDNELKELKHGLD